MIQEPPVASAPPIASAPAAQEDWILKADVMQRLDFPALFSNANPVEIELGAGDGSFLIQRALAAPERNFLGVERLLGRLRKVDRKARRAQLTNVRCLRVEASYVLEWMIPAGGITALHLYFPDPWPKRRHWKRRLVNEDFARVAHVALAPQGLVLLRTDHAGYFEAMESAFGSHAGFERVPTPPELPPLLTDFEREFHARGIPTHHAAYRRLPTQVL